ncbi:LPS export ABC transporter permease LptF [Caldimonas thermodepolymerans]|jgi:Predicted permeases|uniref:Lipopolysaccharide export system permease protein LptF n=1 Tax=Caldimonas thermodepolymerans TaxID=215580 RepID=A0A2S5T7E5_9BURK|nr:LPS export ABC transporter permease LptF [Caldimonas thermodepolymerans]PPE70876.1 LPS export ABC transporter permease LptF [Caldimonas thermodepolymerans]QPC33100.1 LPS export ABC transporter permease LptF [Caldimonas thermodepolymerans]RDI03888.1 lipopolysaccharide export system permease protein [Caldimonas thermodepolymerans]TCP09856.1 lipopolysaccharide export system permease protein [Caldimonas thermodepolymerans]UZG45970.1 LPS export ABC transporter permease LptF [Caldimonas thermodep
MLFDSSVRRELARSFGATLVVLLTIVLTMMLIRTLGQAASGSIAPQHVVLAMGYTVLGHLPTLLSLSLFVAVVSCLSRMYRDSEMTIWFASGVPLGRFLRPVLRLAAPVLAVIAVLALLVWPWANQRNADLRDLYERRSDLSRVAPGQFQSSRDGNRVFFIERNTEDGRTGRNVFVLIRADNREAVTSATTGRIELEGEDRFLVLSQGQRVDRDFETDEKNIAQFETFRILAGEKAVARNENLPPKARSSLELWRHPSARNLGELVWRIGLPLTAFNLLVLGVGLSASNPRRGGSWNLLFALLTFIVYFNLLNLTQGWVAGGKLTPLKALLLVHGGAALAGWLVLRWRERGVAGLFGLGRPRTAAA